jgi:hypothetical protein
MPFQNGYIKVAAFRSPLQQLASLYAEFSLLSINGT